MSEEPPQSALNESQRVEDPEKAHVMALAGDEERTRAAKYRKEANEAEHDISHGDPNLAESAYSAMESADNAAVFADQQANRLEEEAGMYFEDPNKAKQRASEIRSELGKVKEREHALTEELKRIDKLNPHLSETVELADGTRIVREPSGHEWVQHSSISGLSYMGPDDLVGYYDP